MIRHPAQFRVNQGSPELIHGNLLPDRRLYHLGTGNEHIAGIIHHHHKIRKGRGIRGSPCAGSHNCRYLRYLSGGLHIVVKNMAMTGKTLDSLLHSGPARIKKSHNGHHHLQRLLLDCRYLPGVHLADGTAEHGKILSINTHRPSVYLPVARDDPVPLLLFAVHPKIRASVFQKHVGFHKGILVDQKANPLPRCKLPRIMLFPASALSMYDLFLLFQLPALFLVHDKSSPSRLCRYASIFLICGFSYQLPSISTSPSPLSRNTSTTWCRRFLSSAPQYLWTACACAG